MDSWLNYRPDPHDWPFLESIHFADLDTVALFMPGRPIQRITVWVQDSELPRLQTLIRGPVESVKTFKMPSWGSKHSQEDAQALADFLLNLHDVFPEISTLLIGWETVGLADSREFFVSPMFLQNTFCALGRFENLRTLICPIWVVQGESEIGAYNTESLLSCLLTHCPSLREAVLRRNVTEIGPRSMRPHIYENWLWIVGSGCSSESRWVERKWSSRQALIEYVDSL